MKGILKYFFKGRRINNNKVANVNSIKNHIIDKSIKTDKPVNKNTIVINENKEEEYTPKESEMILGTVLGYGAHSTVYIATDSSKNKYVCKKMKRSHRSNALREIFILKKLKDNKYFPNYKFHIETKYNFMIFTEYNKAIDLFEFVNRLIDNGTLTDDIIKDVFLKMAKAIKELHNKGFNHLDIKMENFIILHNDTLDIKLIDFEMSYEHTKELKYIKRCIGTSGYSPLESYKHQYNYQTDIWSLGICLWMLLTNRMPFYHKSLIINDEMDVHFKLLPTPNEKKYIDKNAIELVESILTIDLNKRIELENIITNKWLNEIKIK